MKKLFSVLLVAVLLLAVLAGCQGTVTPPALQESENQRFSPPSFAIGGLGAVHTAPNSINMNSV